MFDKFEFYDLLGILVPGILVVAAVPLAFPTTVDQVASVHFPEGFALLAMTALAAFVGYLVQTIGSLIEPFLDWTWGGRPSEVALSKGLGEKFFPVDTAHRVREHLMSATKRSSSEWSLWIYASQIAESSGSGRVKHFNALYACAVIISRH